MLHGILVSLFVDEELEVDESEEAVGQHSHLPRLQAHDDAIKLRVLLVMVDMILS